MGYSKELNKTFTKDEHGNIVFEDGVIYTPEDMSMLRRLRSESPNAHHRLLAKIHMLKKAFDLGPGLILKQN